MPALIVFPVGRKSMTPDELVGWLPDYLRLPINRLPVRQREAVLYVNVSQHTEGEAAALMGISRDSVRVHLSRAYKTLRLKIVT